jgi:exodeoxyribonuclease V beta subunit
MSVEPFDVCGPLPEGTVVLEASAGTGKTFTIAALTTRYVAEGRATLDQLLVVTFTRAATQELRERVRERMVTAARALREPERARQGDDALACLLAGAADDEVEARRQRLVAALAQFDAATIATTHGFCGQMLAGLGMAADADRDVEPVERLDDLVHEVLDDLYLARYAGSKDEPALEHGTARKVARQATADPHAELVPHPPGTPGHERHQLALDARVELDRRKRARRLLDYDDLLRQLRDALTDPRRGPAAVARVRARYAVVLVDEFQDTDPVQWEILRASFAGHRTLVLIGDPKQAIYAFRGADLVTYLRACAEADSRCTLARNWRSDAGLLEGLTHLLRGAALGSSEIVVGEVAAAHDGPRLTGGPGVAPVRLRAVRRADLDKDDSAQPPVGELRRLIARDLASDVVAQLQETRLRLGCEPTSLGPGDVAVLVRTNDQAVIVRDALGQAGVPAVLAGSRSVFQSRTAREWLTLLRAVEQPHRAGLVRAAALTCFARRDPAALVDPEGDAVDRLGTTLRAWRDVLVERGVAALLEVVTVDERLPELLLAAPDGERQLTDVRHIGQTLHAAATRGQLGPASLVAWLQRRVDEAAEDSDDERSRRLESDADAVQVVTVHASKGLEFPVVYVPFGWDRWVATTPEPLRLHDDERDGRRLLDVGGPDGVGYGERRVQHEREERGEDLRLLYVALTRAKCQVVTWWAPSRNTGTSALHRLLFGDVAPGQEPPPKVTVPGDPKAAKRFAELAAQGSGVLSVEHLDGAERSLTPQHPGNPDQLDVARWRRSLDRAWRRTSYTALTSTAGHATPEAGVASEPEHPERDDEPDTATVAPVDVARAAAAAGALASPLGDLPAGAAFGTLVHRVLEEVDTAADDLDAELLARCEAAVASRLGMPIDPGALAAGLAPVLRTPLGPLAGGRALVDVPPGDRLAELDFELPLAGGDRPREVDLQVGALAAVVRRHLGSDDVLEGYAAVLAGLPGQTLRGYLTGSIDAVLRIEVDDAPRHLVVDYKTNRLGEPGAPLTTWHYRAEAMTAAMVAAHYPLQALLYGVALHRFLRWRLRGYDPAEHLGGVLYLFARGMAGPDTPVLDGMPCGVFSWRPPAGLVPDLSDLLAGEGA